MSKQIVVTVGLDGSVEVSAEGFHGKGCEKATKFIEDELGMAGGKKVKKPEWFQSETVAQRQNV